MRILTQAASQTPISRQHLRDPHLCSPTPGVENHQLFPNPWAANRECPPGILVHFPSGRILLAGSPDSDEKRNPGFLLPSKKSGSPPLGSRTTLLSFSVFIVVPDLWGQETRGQESQHRSHILQSIDHNYTIRINFLHDHLHDVLRN